MNDLISKLARAEAERDYFKALVVFERHESRLCYVGAVPGEDADWCAANKALEKEIETLKSLGVGIEEIDGLV